MSILIVAPEDDVHAIVVAERLREQHADSLIWNTTWFPWRDRLTWEPSFGTALTSLISQNICLNSFHTVWWRRFRKPTLDPDITDPTVKRFCASESLELLRAVFATFSGRKVNDPDRERCAEVKPRQLEIARTTGLAIPATLISNRRDDILSFLDRHKLAICEPLVCDYVHSIPVRQCTAADFLDQQAVAFAPLIVQELIVARLDIRAMVVGSDVFAAELPRPDINVKVDWRFMPTGWQKHILPKAVSDALIKMCRTLGLDFASFDMRLSAEGEYVFLEANPNGQFLFLEVDVGLEVSRAVASYLTNYSGRTN